MKKYIFADKFFYSNCVKDVGFLEIIDGKFGQFFKERTKQAGEVIDYSGRWIAPGLVDTHIHGFLKADVMDNKPETIYQRMSEGLLSCGVTSFLPTTLTAQKDFLEKVVKGIGDNYAKATGAKIRGIYLEGPFFTEAHKGAQNPLYMRNPSVEEFNEWQTAAGGLIKKIGIAPERENSINFIKEITKSGVVVALGHSDATYAETMEAVAAGASSWVHAYNGMRGLTHREPGILGAVFSTKGNYAELICDGHHVHPKACQILMDAVSRENVALVTDCMRAGGEEDGEYTLGEFKVLVKDGAARLETGNLAGSVLKLNEALKNVVDWNIATCAEAINMASLFPARSCQIEDKCGKIAAGLAADFIVLNPDLSLVATYLDGQKRFGV